MGVPVLGRPTLSVRVNNAIIGAPGGREEREDREGSVGRGMEEGGRAERSLT